MRTVNMFIDKIQEELDGAKDYAEKYIEYKTSNPQWSRMCSEMGNDELKHADYLRTIGAEYISKLSWMPEESRDAWDRCCRHFVEKTAIVKLILSK